VTEQDKIWANKALKREVATLTFVPRSVTRGRREAIVIPFSPTVTETFRKVPPLPHFGQNIFPISWVTL
jgi:hypothetical protein